MDTPPTPNERPPEAALTVPPRVADVPSLLVPVDGRRREARRWRTLYRAFADQTPLRATEASVHARLVTLTTVTVRLEQRACSAAEGAVVDDAELVALSNLQARLLEALSLTPATQPERPDPAAHMAMISDPATNSAPPSARIT